MQLAAEIGTILKFTLRTSYRFNFINKYADLYRLLILFLIRKSWRHKAESKTSPAINYLATELSLKTVFLILELTKPVELYKF